jgi:hypothetical protein
MQKKIELLYYVPVTALVLMFFNFYFSSCIFREPGSSIGIVFGYGLDDQEMKVRSPAEAKGFFL